MMRPTTKVYRSVEFGLQTLDDGKTKWTIYPRRKGTTVVEIGIVNGGDDEAEAVCRKIIDTWHGGPISS